MADSALKACKNAKVGCKAALTKLTEYIIHKLEDPDSLTLSELEHLETKFITKQSLLETAITNLTALLETEEEVTNLMSEHIAYVLAKDETLLNIQKHIESRKADLRAAAENAKKNGDGDGNAEGGHAGSGDDEIPEDSSSIAVVKHNSQLTKNDEDLKLPHIVLEKFDGEYPLLYNSFKQQFPCYIGKKPLLKGAYIGKNLC